MSLVIIQGALSSAMALGPSVGSIVVSWPTFQDGDGNLHASDTLIVPVDDDGYYSFELAPTQGSIPNVTYSARYMVGISQQSAVEHWSVPVTQAALTIPQIRLNQSVPSIPFQIPVAQLHSSTANVGDTLVFSGNSFVPTTIQRLFSFQFTAQMNLTFSQLDHAQGTSLLVRVYDSVGNELDPNIQVNPVTGLVNISFNTTTTGYGFIFGGLGRSLPNFAKVYVNQFGPVTIKQSEHRFNTPNLAIEVYDQDGNSISSSAGIQVTPTFDVVVGLQSTSSFKVVIIGALGSSPSVVQGTSQSPTQPFLSTVTAQSSWSIAAATHGKGPYAVPVCFNNQSPAAIVTPLTSTRATDGSLAFTFSAPFTGLIQVS